MRKLIRGIVTFRRHIRPAYRRKFAHLALGQKPDALFIACSDSRVVPNVFASADPGDLFVVRNVGNLVAPAGANGRADRDVSELAALEFALEALNVRDVIVCGHSECGAMKALLGGRQKIRARHLRDWLRHGEPALRTYRRGRRLGGKFEPHNVFSQINVLQQLEHLRSYPAVRQRLAKGQLTLHAWWFDLRRVEVYAYDAAQDRFVPIREDASL